MPVIINGTTGLSGVSTVNLANGSVTQNILANGVAGTGPAIRVARTLSAQSLTQSVTTKILFDTVVFDTANNFSIANSRFTPSVAGYYFVTTAQQLLGTTSLLMYFYKNGSSDSIGNYLATTFANPCCTATSIIYCNGTTDYIEVYINSGAAGTSVNYSAVNNYFTAALVRAA